MAVSEITLSAHAKINLTLDILGKRPDGYHEVRMTMQELALADTVTLRKTEAPGIMLTCNVPDVPTDARNLCVKAAMLLFDRFHIPGGLLIGLTKRIPAAAGLAGGSTDAAAVLRGMRECYGLPLSDEELRAEGKKIGADVPFFMMGGTALSEGIGEILTPVPAVLPFSILLVKPQDSVSTREVYEAYDDTPAEVHPDTEGMLDALQKGDGPGIAARVLNVLEPVTARALPVIPEIREALLSLGAQGARMSGSGPAVFGLFRERETAERAAEEVRKRFSEVFIEVTEPVTKVMKKDTF